MSDAPVYASDDHPAPDSAFVAGELAHLVEGNRGRLLDARRTPVTVVDIAAQRGAFTVRIDAFEDRGARWELGLEEVARFQFHHAAAQATHARLAELGAAAARFDHDLSIACDPDARADSLRRLRQRSEHVRAWLAKRGGAPRVDVAARIARRQGEPALYALLDAFLADGDRDLGALEHAFAAAFVTNPRAGEVVKGHAIVLAELGLCRYDGRAPRDPQLFAGAWSRERRADHLLWRLAFTRELWRALGRPELDLHRAAAADHDFEPPRPATFVSATFSAQVAQAHFEGGPSTRVAVLWRRRIAVERALMTFIETEAMNERFREAEAVLLADPSDPAF